MLTLFTVKPILHLLFSVSKFCAVLGGLLLTLVSLALCFSMFGRNAMGWTLAGDFELAAVASSMAVALFMPWCQASRGHIFVDFFTAKASPAVNHLLDRFGCLLLGLVMLALAWRTGLGGLSAYQTASGSMILGFPEWISYAAIGPALALTGIIALLQALSGHTEGADIPISQAATRPDELQAGNTLKSA